MFLTALFAVRLGKPTDTLPACGSQILEPQITEASNQERQW